MTDSDPLPPDQSLLFHLALRLDGERCLVVGGGPIGARKAASLLASGALVTLVAPEISDAVAGLAAAASSDQLTIEQRRYCAGEAASYRLVITATGVRDVDEGVSLDARRAGVLVNAADEPEWCSFLLPSVLRAGEVSVAVSTGGLSPFMARWVRRRVGSVLGDEVAALAALVGDARRKVRAAGVGTEGLDWDGLAETVWPMLETGRSTEAAQAAGAWATAVIDQAAVRAAGSG